MLFNLILNFIDMKHVKIAIKTFLTYSTHKRDKEFIMASKPMTKTEIIASLAEKTGMKKKEVQNFIDILIQLSYKEAKNGFTFPGLGKLVIQQRKARTGRNPKTGEAIKIPAKKVLKFKIAKACKDSVLPTKK